MSGPYTKKLARCDVDIVSLTHVDTGIYSCRVPSLTMTNSSHQLQSIASYVTIIVTGNRQTDLTIIETDKCGSVLVGMVHMATI